MEEESSQLSKEVMNMEHLKRTEFIFLVVALAAILAIFSVTRASEFQKTLNGQEPLESIEALSEKVKRLELSLIQLQSEMVSLKRHLRERPERFPLSFYKLPEEVYLCGEKIPLEDRRVREHMEREFLVTLDRQGQILLWMKRAGRYFPYIERRLKEMGLPDDLKYITIVESSLRPQAVSSSGAAGIWQFIPSTGEKYGMRKEKALDERFDFLKATEGALIYLKKLHEEFGSWILAMAAYNAGENRVRKEIDFQKTRNYFHLALPTETERYVYKIAVAKMIFSDPTRYGFDLEDHERYPPLLFERVQLDLKQPLPILEVAMALGYYYKEVKEMNPHLLEEVIPAGAQFLHLPSGEVERFWKFLSDWEKALESK